MSFRIACTSSFVRNRFLEPSQQSIPLINPYSLQESTRVSYAHHEDVQDAIANAVEAQKAWYISHTPTQRRDKLLKLADAMSDIKEELAYLETISNGKPIKDSRLDVNDSIDTVRYYAGFSDKLTGFNINLM